MEGESEINESSVSSSTVAKRAMAQLLREVINTATRSG
jgi:hypothetical protein